MINIEFLDKRKTKGIQGFGVSINNLVDKKAHYYSPYNKRHHITFDDVTVFNEISKYTYEEVGEKFYTIQYNFETEDWDFNTSICIHKSEYEKKRLFIYVELNIESEDWNKPYSILQFAETLNTTIEQSNQNYLYHQDDEDFVTNGFGIRFPINIKNIIDNDVKTAISVSQQILQETKLTLIQNLDTDILTTFFSFPENIKTACKQYLIYFAQFLMDLGIDAEVEINEESNNTLFKVIPNSKDESLEKIKLALESYLNAPEFENQNISQLSNDIAVVQWQSNILHLKSQLMIAESVIQLKDATIQNLQLSNFQYQKLVEKENSSKDEEEIIKGIVSVNKLKGKGFSINLPEIVRKLKRKLE